MKILLLCIM